MSKFKAAGSRVLLSVAAVMLALGMAIVGFAPKTAYAGRAEVVAQSEGVFKFNWHYDGKEFANRDFSRGSCFLINEDHVITAYHCTMFSDKELTAAGLSAKDKKDLRKQFSYSVNVYRDMTIDATLVAESEEQDYAVFKLKQPVGGSKPLSFRDSSTVEAGETIWALGFPGDSDLKIYNTYDSNDVTVRNGVVSKPEGDYQGETSDGFVINGKFLQSDCRLEGGDSGGPMLDDNGAVVGIAVNSTDNYYFCVASDEIFKGLTKNSIQYTRIDDSTAPASTTTVGGNATEPTTTEVAQLNVTDIATAITKAESVSAEDYTEESYAALKSALDAAKTAQGITLDGSEDQAARDAKQKQIDDATAALTAAQNGLVAAETKSGPNMLLIGGIALAVLAAAGIAFVLLRKKKPEPTYNPSVAPAPMPAPAPAPIPAPAQVTTAPQLSPAQMTTPVAPAAPTMIDDSPSTTVLVDDDPATTILSEDVDGGTLTRMSTNEKIYINRSELSLGRERASVDYCLEGNSNISRVHARVIVRDGMVYIIDNNTPNGTFVNNAKLRPGLEQLLKPGDIVRLADEKFRYNR